MTRARRRVLLFAGLLVVAGAVALAVTPRPSPVAERPVAERPPLMLLTALPLMFGEGFSLESGGSKALTALESRYRVLPISTSSAAELAKGKLLLMAQPLAQTPENLVALDEWVRRGGRVLLLADPRLEWPSERPLGDRLRPPLMFMDTGLLAHWGVRLDAPEERGAVGRKIGSYDVVAVSPGSLEGKCKISQDRLVAHCAVGRGQATIIADADLIGTEHLGDAAGANLDAVLSELAKLERE
jgi:hypothetical protein